MRLMCNIECTSEETERMRLLPHLVSSQVPNSAAVACLVYIQVEECSVTAPWAVVFESI